MRVPSLALAASVFKATYSEQRSQFLTECAAAGVKAATIEHPLLGPSGENLGIDVARFGNPTAPALLIVTSGTHGIEGFCGSAIQSALLRLEFFRELPPTVAVVLVHALNPYGFAWLRRTDEKNIDLNRNFVDFSEPRQANVAYDEIHAALVPEDWSGPAKNAADAQLNTYVDSRGMRQLQAAVFGGQYDHSDGMVFGGHQPAWSNTQWYKILADYALHAQRVAVLDVHSGLGEPGACELISGARHGTPEFGAAQAWFGTSIVFPGGTSTAPAASGYMGNTLKAALPSAVGALVVAEFGTVAFDSIFEVLRMDNWVHAYDKPNSTLWRRAKAGMYDAFVRPDASWKEAIAKGGVTLTQRVVAALAAD